MDLTISSKKIGNPLLVELSRKLTVSFSRMHREFYVIGATARDIILKQVVGSESKRRTMDLDIAIAIPNWETFAEVQDVLVADGFTGNVAMKSAEGTIKAFKTVLKNEIMSKVLTSI